MDDLLEIAQTKGLEAQRPAAVVAEAAPAAAEAPDVAPPVAAHAPREPAAEQPAPADDHVHPEEAAPQDDLM